MVTLVLLHERKVKSERFYIGLEQVPINFVLIGSRVSGG